MIIDFDAQTVTHIDKANKTLLGLQEFQTSQARLKKFKSRECPGRFQGETGQHKTINGFNASRSHDDCAEWTCRSKGSSPV